MKFFTDNIDFAKEYFPEMETWQKYNSTEKNKGLGELIKRLYAGRTIYHLETDILSDRDLFDYLFLIEHASQSHYDLLIDLCREKYKLPDKIACLAGSGDKFHGFKNRSWEAVSGNIHLVAYLSPQTIITKFAPGFMAMTALSVIQTIDSVDTLSNRAAIKWVNDIFIDNSKVCGVLAYSQSEGEIVTDVILGIGLNLLHNPSVKPTIFVPKSAALIDFVEHKTTLIPGKITQKLLESLMQNYHHLIENNYQKIINGYISRSPVIGKGVIIHSDFGTGNDEIIASGKIVKIGDNLELYLDNHSEPITSGRLEIEL